MGELIKMKTYFKKQVKKNTANVKQNKKDIERFKKCFTFLKDNIHYYNDKMKVIIYCKTIDFMEINYGLHYADHISIMFTDDRIMIHHCEDMNLAKEFMDWFIAKIDVQ